MARPAHPTRREDILAAARVEFGAKGYSAARMEDIGRRAGVSKAAVYLQFASKEAIFHALVRELVETMLPDDLPQEFGDVPAPVLLAGFVTRAFDLCAQQDVAFLPRLVLGEGQKFPELVRFYHDEGILRLLGVVEAIIRHGIARGEFACDSPVDACRSIAGGLVLTALWRITFEPVGAEPVDVARAARTHVDILLNGLMARKDD